MIVAKKLVDGCFWFLVTSLLLTEYSSLLGRGVRGIYNSKRLCVLANMVELNHESGRRASIYVLYTTHKWRKEIHKVRISFTFSNMPRDMCPPCCYYVCTDTVHTCYP